MILLFELLWIGSEDIEAGSAPGLKWLGCFGDWPEMVRLCEPDHLTVGNHDTLSHSASGQLFSGDQIVQRTNANAELSGRFLTGIEKPRPLYHLYNHGNSKEQNCR